MKVRSMNFKSVFNAIGLLAICILLNTTTALAKPKPKILVFSKTKGFHHSSIAVGNTAIIKLGAENNFDMDTTTDASKFTLDNLKQYSAIVFLSTTGLSNQLFTEDQKTALMKYMEQGGGYMGIHAATDCCYDWQWYGNMSGAYFKGHPAQQDAVIDVVDASTIATSFLPKEWKRKDEWYSFKWMATDLHVILKIDESSYQQPNLQMGDHPMAWYHTYDGGRAFYTELGHTDESYADPLYLKHILGGIQYAAGIKKINK
ncbi:ThuA domain-containing protein [Mucilaginibacter sp. dw_454]|uniref:ThuA domain-containing protein n=1 Tax=Mucilaginibacter sp. dw_454 TaxID=2720079 RepID=UPI001BD2EB2D|nr:ThuA domain-containing protein [Mucilaginibacter sp. dw_454]